MDVDAVAAGGVNHGVEGRCNGARLDGAHPISAARPNMPDQNHDRPRLVALLLIVIAAIGVIDAVSILHFGAFTAFVTGTIILLGAEIVGQAHAGATKAIVLVAYFGGAILGGRLMRRPKAAERLLADSLFVTVALLLAAALVIATLGIETPAFHWTAAALIAIAMGSQTSASRHLAVPDMVLPLATLAVHGLAHDSRLAGGREERTPRRLGIVCALLLGAAAGAALSAYSVWPGLLLAAALLALAGIFALRIATNVVPRERADP
jgi:uncharacterized membrane protein YoaK (UPF0700 family)